MTHWTSIAKLHKELGVSRRVLDRALEADNIVPTKSGPVLIEVRDADPEDLVLAGVTRNTKRVVRRSPSSLGDVRAMADEAIEGRGSAGETLEWLERVARGEEFRTVFTAKGEKFEDEPWTETARLSAAMNAQKLREYIDDRDNNYIPKDLVADALVSTAQLLAERLSAIPARLADRVSSGATTAEIRAALTLAIDEVREELGDAAERHLESLLGGET